jgi:hypothetical protein
MLLFLLITTATAEEKWTRGWGRNGNTFVLACKAAVQKIDDSEWQGTKQEAQNAGFCTGFVSGIAETMNEGDGVDFSDAVITRDQLIRVVQKYMEDHPEQLAKPASWLVRQALLKAFPVKH